MLTSTTRSLTAPTSSSIDAGALNASLPTESTAATAYVITPRGGESLTGVTAVRAVISTPLRYTLYRTGVSPPEGCCQVICTPAKASWTTTLVGASGGVRSEVAMTTLEFVLSAPRRVAVTAKRYGPSAGGTLVMATEVRLSATSTAGATLLVPGSRYSR